MLGKENRFAALEEQRDSHGAVRNAKHVIHRELLGVGIVRSQQFRQQIDARGVVAPVGLFPLFEFLDRDLGHGRRAGFPEGQERAEGIVAEQDVEFGDLAHDPVVPLHVVDVLDRAFDVDFCFEETELSREGDYAEDLWEWSALPSGPGTR